MRPARGPPASGRRPGPLPAEARRGPEDRALRTLALLLALAWFWLLFYGVGPLTSRREIAVGAGALLVVCLAGALLGALRARR